MRVSRVIRYFTYYWLLRWLPASYRPVTGPMSRWLRYLTCRGLFATCGRGVNIEHGADFGGGASLEIGDRSGIGVNCRVPYDVRIGKDVMMGPEVIILGVNHKFDDCNRPMLEQGYFDRRPVLIEDDVWIGTRAIILPGVKLGRGAIVAAGAVVTRDVEDFDIVAGNPARVIRNRQQQEKA